MAFLDRLKKLRIDQGASQAAMADAMGVSEATYQNYEYGKTPIPAEKLVAVGLKFKVPAKWFFNDDAEILVEDVRDAVQLIEKSGKAKTLDLDKRSKVIALTARVMARERELGRQGDFAGRLRGFVDETISLLE